MSESAVTPECWTEKRVKARKPHKCCECRGEIKPGETYLHLSGIWEGEPRRFKFCTDCVSLKEQLEKMFPILRNEYGIEDLGQWVFDSENPSLLKAWLDNRTRRGVTNSQWMIDELNKLTNPSECSKC